MDFNDLESELDSEETFHERRSEYIKSTYSRFAGVTKSEREEIERR